MTGVSIIILIGYIILHLFSTIQTDRCLAARTKKSGPYRIIRPIWIILYFCVWVLPILGTFWPESALKYQVMKIGNLTLGFDIYYCGFLLIFTIVDGIIVLIQKKKFDMDPPKAIWLMILSVILAIILPVYGMIHAQQPVASYWEADLTDGAQAKGEIRIVLLADFHLSVNSNPQLIEKMAALTNEQNPDYIFCTGDFFTSNYEGLENPDAYIEAFQTLQAQKGIYAVYGNHDVKEDLFCGFAISPVSKAFRQPEMTEFIEKCGFTLLVDEVTELEGGDIVLVGRNDADKAGDGTANRLSVEELFTGLDPDATIFVLEHEPNEYTDLEGSGADIVFSGHTHNGQIWPCNIFVQFMTKNAYGYKDINGMATFVTSGVGYFGPPQRSGTNSEVMVIDITY